MKIIYTIKKEEILVDDEDYEELNKHAWHLNAAKYAVRTGKTYETRRNKTIFIHREIMNAPEGKDVDHINHKTLDNQKLNLRVCSRSENVRNRKLSKKNTSGCTGVNWNKRTQTWISRIRDSGRDVYLGGFENLEDAIKAKKKAEVLYYKEFLNNDSKEDHEVIAKNIERATIINETNKIKRKPNTSGKTGVHFDKRDESWIAYIGVNKTRIYIGGYKTFDEAKTAREEAELKYYGRTAEDKNIEQC